ncbi:MAG: YigZ family protein [Bacteroidaceae bacterium]|nr:YigZ family protein [Bacteroidaceae bacterium]
MTDTYLTISGQAEGEYTEKRSKFLAIAHHVENTEEIKTLVSAYERKYHDARHVCYAYMLGPRQENYRAVDNGEPSGTAGKPILRQIMSHNLTNVVVVVVRYFGGIKLGTSGLIDAYQAATEEALQAANIIEETIDRIIKVDFEYALMNSVMRIVKEEQPKILEQDFQMNCHLRLQVRESMIERITKRLSEIRGIHWEESTN